MSRALTGPLVFVAQIAALGLILAAAGGMARAASPRRPSDAERGRELYERMCLACHGAGARGDGPAASGLVGGVPDLGGRFPDSSIEAAISMVLRGKGAMPSYEATIDSYDARRVLRHMSGLASKPQPATPVREAPPVTSPSGPGQAPPPVAPEEPK